MWTSSGWLHSEHACGILNDGREKIVSFLESVLGLGAHDSKGIVMQSSAKTKPLPGLRGRGTLGAWEASVLKAEESRIHTFLVRQQKRRVLFCFLWGRFVC